MWTITVRLISGGGGGSVNIKKILFKTYEKL